MVSIPYIGEESGVESKRNLIVKDRAEGINNQLKRDDLQYEPYFGTSDAYPFIVVTCIFLVTKAS